MSDTVATVTTENEEKTGLFLKTFEFMQYVSHYDTDDITVLQSRIEDLTQLKTYCTILHDKDTLADGSPKPPHFHAVVTLKNAMTVESLAKSLHVETQFINKIKTTTRKAQEYLIHLNQPTKFQYDPREVVANFDYVKMIEITTQGNKKKIDIENIVEKIANGEVKRYNIYNFIDVYTFAKNKVVFDRAFEYREKKNRSVERNMEVIYLYGKSGTGKTTLAKFMATSKGYSSFVSDGGKNPLDSYEGQECIILDDFRPANMTLSEYLKLTDNHTDSLVGCRYYNKSIYECKLLIITSTLTPTEFANSFENSLNEDKKQVYRRISGFIEVSQDTIMMAFYNGENIVPQKKADNPVAYIFQPQRMLNLGEAFARNFGFKNLRNANAKPQMSIYDDDNDPFEK